MNRFISKLDEGKDFLFSNGIRHFIFNRKEEKVYVKELGTENVFLLSPMTWDYFIFVFTIGYEPKKYILENYKTNFPTGKWMITIFHNFQTITSPLNNQVLKQLIYLGKYKKQTEKEINNYLKIFKNEKFRRN